jgi:hypothetical protein
MANKKKIEVYYAGKSKTLYLMLPNGDSYFVTNGGAVGKTHGQRGLKVSNFLGGSYENSKLVCELTPKVIRQIKKAFGALG